MVLQESDLYNSSFNDVIITSLFCQRQPLSRSTACNRIGNCGLVFMILEVRQVTKVTNYEVIDDRGLSPKNMNTMLVALWSFCVRFIIKLLWPKFWLFILYAVKWHWQTSHNFLYFIGILYSYLDKFKFLLDIWLKLVIPS